MAEKTCFVISPLSEKDSLIRKEADDLLWIIRQAVSNHGFKVVRIDEIAKSHEITREIIRLVKESELCIIVLTSNNPNVFYEAGIRHEAGGPFIHLVKEGEKLPFDVAGINTIHYGDIKELDHAKKLATAIEQFVVNVRSEIDGHPRRVTLELIVEMLNRLDNKVSRLAVGAGLTRPQGLEDARVAMRNPKEAFMLAIAEGDVAGATALLPRLESLIGRNEEFFRAVLMCTAGGSQGGVEIAKNFLVTRPEWFGKEQAIATVGMLVNYSYCRRFSSLLS